MGNQPGKQSEYLRHWCPHPHRKNMSGVTYVPSDGLFVTAPLCTNANRPSPQAIVLIQNQQRQCDIQHCSAMLVHIRTWTWRSYVPFDMRERHTREQDGLQSTHAKARVAEHMEGSQLPHMCETTNACPITYATQSNLEKRNRHPH